MMKGNALRLKFLSHVEMGQSPPSESYNTTGEGLPFLQGNADFGLEHPVASMFCPDPPKRAQVGDILLSVRAPVGALNVADREYGIGRGLCAVRPNRRRLDPQFTRYAFVAGAWQLDSIATGSTYDAVSAADVSNMLVPEHELETQRPIVAFLDRETARIDALITKEERLLTLLEEKRTALITRAVTKGLDPVPMTDSGVKWLGALPKHWEAKRLKFAVPDLTVGIVVTPAKYYVDEGVPCLRSLNISSGIISLSDVVYISRESNELHRKSQIREGDVLVVRTGLAGAAVVVPRDLEGANCIDLLIIRRSPMVMSDFLRYVLSSTAVAAQVEAYTEGAIQGHYNTSTLAQLFIPIPPISEQARIVDHLGEETDRLARLRGHVMRAIALLREYRTALISAAVTGQIDVSGGMREVGR